VNRAVHLSAVLLLVGAGYSVRAQEVRASISGIITDPSGAPVSGALVTVTNTETSTSEQTKSNESGAYLTPFLQPGSYRLAVENAGFKRHVREDIVLQTLDKLRLDVKLELGTVSEAVTVTGETTALQTETASRGQTLAQELMENLPTQGRNPFQIAWAAPGVVKAGTFRYLRSWDIGGTTGFSINGGRTSTNEVLLDGISNVQASGQVIHVPTMDAVQEFKVLTNTYDAQYGRMGGGAVTIVTKSGGNQLHGTAYEYLQNDKLNANQSELNSAGRAKSPNHINTFGFAASGPVVIPKVFDGRNRLFWMVSYEGARQRSADPAVYTFPQMNWRNGDFSDLANASGQTVTIYDPTSTTAAGKRTAYAGNVIPAALINPVAKNVFQYYPDPTSSGTGPAHLNNYTFPSRWIGNMDQWIGKLDFHVNSKNVVSFRYGENPYNEYRSLVFVSSATADNPAEPSGNAPLLRDGRNIMMDWTSTVSSRIVFDLKAGLNRWEETGGNMFGAGYDPTKLGMSSSLVSQFTQLQFPQFQLGTYQTIGSSSLLHFGAHDTYTLQPSVNIVQGRHFLKFGFEARRYLDNNQNPGMADGTYTFAKDWTQSNPLSGDSTSGNEIATFLLGYPTAASVDKNINTAYKHDYYALFLQDDIKLTDRLTVNLGFRWDGETPATERYNRMMTYVDLDESSPLASQVTSLNLKGATKFAGVNGISNRSFDTDWNNYGPRVGAAYRLGDKWVLRGGYGLYFLGQSATGTNQGFSQQTVATLSTDGNLTPAVNLTNAFANQANGQLLSAIGSSQGAGSFYGQSVTSNYMKRPLPYTHQYSFDIQRQLPGNFLVEVAYAGNLTNKLPLTNTNNVVNLNYIPQALLGNANSYYTQKVTNPMAGLMPNNASMNGATITQQQLLYNYPQYSQLSLANVPIGKQRYDGFQSKITKRFASGFSLLASYTVSKDLQQMHIQNPQDFSLSDIYSTPLVKEPADQIDVPQKFNITGLYEFPFGRGKKFGASMPKVFDALAGGWEINWNVTYASGSELAYPNAAQTVAGSAKLDSPTMSKWFDTSKWVDSSTGKNVTAPNLNYNSRTFPYEFSNIRLPGYQNWDASLSKAFKIHETIRTQFRFEAVNLMNHPQYGSIQSVDVTNSQFGRLNPTQSNLPRFLKLSLKMNW
jgi:hypothetical protein